MYTDESTAFPQGMEPSTVIQSFDAAWNAHDVERALKFFTEDAVIRFMYPAPYPEPDTYTGKEEIRQLLEGFFRDNYRVQSYDYEVSLNQLTWKYRAASERFRQLGLDEADGSSGAAFESGKIKRLTIAFSPDTTARLAAGLDRAGVPGPISEGLAGLVTPEDAGAHDIEEPRPNRGPTWDPVGAEDHQPPPTQE